MTDHPSGDSLRARTKAAIRWVEEWLPNRMDDTYAYERADVLKTLREAADALRVSPVSEGSPAAWLHILHVEMGQQTKRLSFSLQNPFGASDIDYDRSYQIESVPLYESSPALPPATPEQESR